MSMLFWASHFYLGTPRNWILISDRWQLLPGQMARKDILFCSSQFLFYTISGVSLSSHHIRNNRRLLQAATNTCEMNSKQNTKLKSFPTKNNNTKMTKPSPLILKFMTMSMTTAASYGVATLFAPWSVGEWRRANTLIYILVLPLLTTACLLLRHLRT